MNWNSYKVVVRGVELYDLRRTIKGYSANKDWEQERKILA